MAFAKDILQTSARVIRTCDTDGANTAERVGKMFVDLINETDTAISNNEIKEVKFLATANGAALLITTKGARLTCEVTMATDLASGLMRGSDHVRLGEAYDTATKAYNIATACQSTDEGLRADLTTAQTTADAAMNNANNALDSAHSALSSANAAVTLANAAQAAISSLRLALANISADCVPSVPVTALNALTDPMYNGRIVAIYTVINESNVVGTLEVINIPPVGTATAGAKTADVMQIFTTCWTINSAGVISQMSDAHYSLHTYTRVFTASSLPQAGVDILPTSDEDAGADNNSTGDGGKDAGTETTADADGYYTLSSGIRIKPSSEGALDGPTTDELSKYATRAGTWSAWSERTNSVLA